MWSKMNISPPSNAEAKLVPYSRKLQYKQLNKCTQSVQICSTWPIENAVAPQFCLDQEMSEKEVLIFFVIFYGQSIQLHMFLHMPIGWYRAVIFVPRTNLFFPSSLAFLRALRSFSQKEGNFWADKGGYFQKLTYGSETIGMTSEGLGETSEGDFADMCIEKFPLMLMGGRANKCRQWVRTSIAMSGNSTTKPFFKNLVAFLGLRFVSSCGLGFFSYA
jgi:hypothetical protein